MLVITFVLYYSSYESLYSTIWSLADDVFWSKDAIITGWGNKESVKRADSPTTQLQYAANLVVETPTNCEVVLRVRSSIRNKDIFKQYEKFKGIPETFICTRSKLKTSDVYLAPVSC